MQIDSDKSKFIITTTVKNNNNNFFLKKGKKKKDVELFHHSRKFPCVPLQLVPTPISYPMQLLT